MLYGNLGRGGYEFAMAFRAKAMGGTVKTVGECLQAEGAKEVTLVFTVDPTCHYSGEERDTYAGDFLKSCAQGKTTCMSEDGGEGSGGNVSDSDRDLSGPSDNLPGGQSPLEQREYTGWSRAVRTGLFYCPLCPCSGRQVP